MPNDQVMKKVAIEEFLSLARQYKVLDVRSPEEYRHAHIPGAYNLPLFSDDERKVVGTAYKQQGREQAIKIGLDYFGVRMRKMVEEAELINSGSKGPVLVHCWRGGMRSAGVAWLLDLYGYEVYVLIGGYKSFRNWVLQQFEQPYSFKVLGGYTGSGKTEVLQQLNEEKKSVLDLEKIAHHKGSAFGSLGQPEQPTQEMFENKLGVELHDIAAYDQTWIEDESSRIGSVNLPPALWKTMRSSRLYFLDVPFEERLDYITEAYGKFEKKELITSVMRLQKRLGGQNTKDVIGYILDGNIKEGFRILLRYYDKYYANSLEERKAIAGQVTMVICEGVDTEINIAKLKKEKAIV